MPAKQPLITDPFDQHARAYAECWEAEAPAIAQRRAVHATMDRWLAPDARVLDLGCGTGIDAAWLQSTGRSVLARDASPGMVAAARARGVAAERLPAEQLAALHSAPLDGALLNFGVLNCIPDLEALSRDLSRLLRPGASLFPVLMPRLSPAWTLGALKRGGLRAAWARAQAVTDVPVEGRPVRVTYHNPSAVIAAFQSAFVRVDQLGLGFLLPPPGSRRAAALTPTFDRLEAPLRRLPGLRQVGDHVLIVLQRLPDPLREAER
jgi:SAM-dependent methyltransferase